MKKLLLILSCSMLLLQFSAMSGSTNDNILLPSGMPPSFGKAGFVENRGQFQKDILYKAALPGVNIIVTQTGIVYDFYQIVNKSVDNTGLKQGHVIKMTLEKALTSNKAKGENPLQEYSNYFIGNDKSKWASHVSKYSNVKISELFSGVDAILRLEGNKPRYDFILKPGASIRNISLTFTGQDSWRIDNDMGLIFNTQLGEIVNGKIYAYQNINGIKKEIQCNFINRNGKIGFVVASYDKSLPLVIDPLVYGSYIGGDKDDKITGIVNATDNSFLITGWTESTGFVTTPGAYKEIYSDNRDAFVAKFKIDGATPMLIFSTLIGDLGFDESIGIKSDADGNIYIAGNTNSAAFPTENPFMMDPGGFMDGFVAKFSSDGASLIYSSFFGGNKEDYIHGLDINDSGNLYIVGETLSTNFPVQAGAYQTKKKGLTDAFCAKMSSSGSMLDFGTYLGGNTEDRGFAVSVDQSDAVYITGTTNSADFPYLPYRRDGWNNLLESPYDITYNGGYDAFVIKIQEGSIQYSTYFGGSADDAGKTIVANNDGTVFFAGETTKEIGTAKFPIKQVSYQSAQAGGTDMFFAKLDIIKVTSAPWGGTRKTQDLLSSTFIGKKTNDSIMGMMRSPDKSTLYLYGKTNSSDFPVIVENTKFTSGYEGFVLQMTYSGTDILYSNLYPGNKDDCVSGFTIDSRGDLIIAGSSNSSNISVTESALQKISGGMSDGFILKQSQAKMTLVSPVGGNYCTGNSVKIEWILENISDTDPFKLEYKDITTDEWILISENVKGTTFNWTLPDNLLPDINYIIRISHGSGAFSVQNEPFVIGGHPALNSFLSTPEVPELCEGESFTINSSATGNNLNYIWYFNGVKIDNMTDSVLTITNVKTSNAGKYKVVIKGTCPPDAVSSEISVIIKPTTVIQNQPQAKSIEEGKQVDFSVTAAGTNLTYQWMRNGSNIIGETKNTFSILKVTKADEGNYSCKVTGACGNETSTEAALTVLPNWVNPGNSVSTSKLKVEIENQANSDNITIKLTSECACVAKVYIADYTGRVLEDVHNGNIEQGISRFDVNTASFLSGVYWLITDCGGERAANKLQIIK